MGSNEADIVYAYHTCRNAYLDVNTGGNSMNPTQISKRSAAFLLEEAGSNVMYTMLYRARDERTILIG